LFFVVVDIDECKDGSHECQINTKCVNLVGSYNCVCQDGYVGNGLFCDDIDECKMNRDDCNSKAECTNLKGSYSCRCKEGYTGDGVSCLGKDI
jgi:hypothetical protein